ncbi:MAG TPA: sigma-70 family RNA polymerase sigma factor, partial [Flavisolibacter sp.]|nr:sigma-70 family RNA polymerase sigma factor [Flavisolibacter sp.]
LDKIKLAAKPVHIEITNDLDIAEFDNPLKRMEGREVFKMLDCLPPSTRAVCSLFYMEGFSIKNICDVLKISPGTVKWHLSESRKKLQPVAEKHYLRK